MKKIIGMLLIVFIIGISIYENVEKRKDMKELDNLNIGEVNIEGIKENTEHEDILGVLENYDNGSDLVLKSTNYHIMKFFKSINEKRFEDIDVYPEYKNFFNLSDNFLTEDYVDLDNLIYEIVSISRKSNNFLVDVKYKEENKDVVYSKTFSIDDKYIIDEPFISIEGLNHITDNYKYLITVDGKAMYRGKDVYKVRVKNKTNEVIKIDSNMYGFYGINSLNKYYHRLVNNSSSYEVLPNAENIYYVEILGKNIDNLYINIEGEGLIIL